MAIVFDAPIALLAKLLSWKGGQDVHIITAIGLSQPWSSASEFPALSFLCQEVANAGEYCAFDAVDVGDQRAHPRVQTFIGVPINADDTSYVIAVSDSENRTWDAHSEWAFDDLAAVFSWYIDTTDMPVPDVFERIDRDDVWYIGELIEIIQFAAEIRIERSFKLPESSELWKP